MFKKVKNKKLLTIGLILGLFVIINLITNYKFFYRILYKDGEATFSGSDFVYNNNTYEISNINKNVKLIELEFDTVPSEMMIEFTNEDFVNYAHFNSNYYTNNLKKTMYIPCSLNGKMNSIRISTNDGSLVKATVNPRISYQLNAVKTFIAFTVIFCLIIVLKNKEKLNLKDKSQKINCLIVILLACFLAVSYYSNNRNRGTYSFYNVYYTDAIIAHRLDLDVQIDPNLKASTNPYDSSNRNFNYILDASYYNGKYYCYFGILPNLLLFVPYKLITGNYMYNSMACLIYTILSIVATYFLFSAIVKKYFKDIKFRTYILTFLYILLGSKLFWCMHRPDYYELIVIAAYFHVILGLYLVLFNENESKFRDLIGYTFLASAVLVRPTALLASVFAIPKIIDKFKKYKFKISKWWPLLVPYFVIGVITMYMNYVRFGSILEFGVSYQLASNNLSAKNFSLLNGVIGSMYYLFATYNVKFLPLSIISNTNSFPILTDFRVESIGGGVMATSFLGFIIFGIPWIVKYIKEKKLKTYVIIATVLAICMIFISSSIGATIGRYMMDFNYLIYFVIIAVSLYFIQEKDNKVLPKVYTGIIIISIIVNFLLSLSNIY